jgi:hypothetical protein
MTIIAKFERLGARNYGKNEKKACSFSGIHESFGNHQQLSPEKRNPIEGKSGQAKTADGLNRTKQGSVKAGESWIASIILVLFSFVKS